MNRYHVVFQRGRGPRPRLHLVIMTARSTKQIEREAASTNRRTRNPKEKVRIIAIHKLNEPPERKDERT